MPARLSVVYYYLGSQGQRVAHGPYTEYHADGRIHTIGVVRHGEADGRWLEYDDKGTLTTESIWRSGQRVGWGNYADGQISFYREDLYVDGEVVAVKAFEGGRWTIIGYPGCPPLFAVNSATGQMSHLPVPGSPPRCRP